jgi:hypothetical protein
MFDEIEQINSFSLSSSFIKKWMSRSRITNRSVALVMARGREDRSLLPHIKRIFFQPSQPSADDGRGTMTRQLRCSGSAGAC